MSDIESDFKKRLDVVYENLLRDNRLTSSHVSLYLSLILLYEKSLFANPFNINRKQLMGISKIGSFATYHKCINQLERFGYIKYFPTFNSFIGSCVELL